MANILVLGAGVWGTAVASTLVDCDHKVDVWSYSDKNISDLNRGKHINLREPYSDKIRFFSSDLETIKDYDFIFIALPTQHIRENIKRIKIDSKFIILSKGIEILSGKRISEVLQEYGFKNVATLYGPTHADDLLTNAKSMMVASSESIGIAKKIEELFDKSSIKIFCDNNIIFSEFASALKNIYAIAYGILTGMKCSENSRAALFSYSAMEMERFIKEFTKNFNMNMPNGIGDLLVTCIKGRNSTFGNYLGRGFSIDNTFKEMNMVVEGFSTVKAIKKICEDINLDLKLNNLVYSILYKKENYERILEIFEGDL